MAAEISRKETTPRRAIPSAGRINSEGTRPWWDRDITDLVIPHKFERPFISTPNITTALGHFDLGGYHGRTIGVKATADTVDIDEFSTRLSIWGDGAMTSGSCAWLATSRKDYRFRTGVCRTLRGSPKTFDVNFDRPFKGHDQPTVLVWISGFQMKLKGEWSLSVSAISPTKDGFKLVIETGEDTELHQGLFSWLAFMPGEKKIDGGRLDGFSINLGKDAEDCKEHEDAVPEQVEFKKKFDSTPGVMMGISGVSMGGKGMRLALYPPKVNNDNTGLEVNVKTWWYSIVKSASVSWVAVAKSV